MIRKVNLFPVAVHSAIMSSLLAMVWGIYTVCVRTPAGDEAPAYVFLWPFFCPILIGTAWYAVWMVTPRRFWDDRVRDEDAE